MSDKATSQRDNYVPARRALMAAIAIDGTARSWDLTKINLGQAYKGDAVNDEVYLTLTADGADVYYVFDSQGASVTLDDTTKDAVGASPNTPTNTNSRGDLLVNKVEKRVRIRRNLDKFIHVKCTGAGTAILRIVASSQPGV